MACLVHVLIPAYRHVAPIHAPTLHALDKAIDDDVEDAAGNAPVFVWLTRNVGDHPERALLINVHTSFP